MKTITLEEHFVTEEFLKATGAFAEGSPMAALRPKLLDVGAGRVAAMDAGGVDMQVLSLAAIGVDKLGRANGTALMRDVNDELAAAVRAHPERLGGWATLELKDPDGAAKEFRRCVEELGFKGALVDGTVDGEFLDAAKFEPVWEAADALGVPVYLHPAPPPAKVMDVYYTGLPGEAGEMLSIAGWGWHAETALHTLRLIVAGVFDRRPGVQLIIGHMGEMLPMALARSSAILSRTAKLRQPVAEYFRTNVHVTTSGYFTQPPLRCALEVVGIDRLMYSVDYPFSATTQGQAFLEDAAGVAGRGRDAQADAWERGAAAEAVTVWLAAISGSGVSAKSGSS